MIPEYKAFLCNVEKGGICPAYTGMKKGEHL